MDVTESIDTESTATPSVVERQRRRALAERRADLEADSRAEEAQHDRVKCRGCKTWIQLSKKRPYDLHHWQRHLERCKAITYVPLLKACAR